MTEKVGATGKGVPAFVSVIRSQTDGRDSGKTRASPFNIDSARDSCHALRVTLKKITKRVVRPYRSAFSIAVVGCALLAIWRVDGPARAAILYWDTDGSTTGNNASTGASLGGSGTWSTVNANWWDTGLGTLQIWTDGSDAVFWGTAGLVTASSVFANSLDFKTTGYSLNSGALTMIGAASFNVDTGVTATVSSAITGTNTMMKLGAGTLILNNTNNLNTANAAAGGWRIEGGGTLRIMGDGSLGAPLPDAARNTVTDIQLNQSTIQAGADFAVSQNRRTKINTNASTNRGDAIIDVDAHVLTWYGSLQGGAGSLRVTSRGGNGGMLILGTDKIASINPFGSVLPAGATNLTVQDRVVVQTSGQVTPTGGELGSETNSSGALLAIKLESGGQIRSESGDYTFLRNLVLGTGGGSLDVGAWIQTFAGGTVSGPGTLTKFGTGTLVLDNPSATWAGGTSIRGGTLQLGRGGSNGLLPGTPGNPSSVVISGGATLRFNRGSNKSFFDIISGAGGITVANSPTAKVRLVSDNTYTGPTAINSGMLMIGQGNPGEPGSIVSSVVNNSGTLAFNRVENLTYAGAISGPGTLEKQAAGDLTLTGIHTYTGTTTVSAGTLIVNGVIGASAVTVTNGTLGGNGLIKGPVTIQSPGRLAPGTSIGVLTISNALNLGGVTVMELNAVTRTNDVVRGLTIVTYGGTLTLSNLAGAIAASNAFKLFSANVYRGAFATLTPASPGSNLAWNTNTLTTDGTLRAVSTVPPAMSNIISSGLLTLSWPTDHIGWRLQVQTNSISVGLSGNWFNIANSIATNQMTFPVNASAGCVFYRLVYP
jgi:autotransporter-associated beta strand protein